MAGILDAPGYYERPASLANPQVLGAAGAGWGTPSDFIDLWNRLQHLEARLTLLENPAPVNAPSQDELVIAARDELTKERKRREAVEEKLRRVVGAAKAFLRYFNPSELASDKENQWLSLSDQCMFAEDLLKSNS